MFHVSMLRKNNPDPTHMLRTGELMVDKYLSFETHPVNILMRREKVIPLVIVLWRLSGVEEETWKRKD